MISLGRAPFLSFRFFFFFLFSSTWHLLGHLGEMAYLLCIYME